MGKPNEAQRKWLEELGAMGGGGETLAALLAEPPKDAGARPIAATMGGGGEGLATLLAERAAGEASPTAGFPRSASEPDVPTGPIAAALGDQDMKMAEGAKGTLKLPTGGKPSANKFVPALEISGGSKRELAIRGKLTLDLTVRNWAKRPKGTMLVWSVTGSNKALNFEFEKLDGGGTVTVTGLATGKGVVKVEVKVVGGGTYRFPDAVFTVYSVAKNATMWVPELETPSTLNREVPVNVKVELHLKVNNWDERPKGTILGWGASTSSTAVGVKIEGRGGEGTITVKGLEPGKAVVKADVEVKGGGNYAFSDTPFNVVENTDPDSSPDQGGVANITDLEQDMRNILQDWHSAAQTGIEQFVTNALSKHIDELESGSTKSFLVTLLGNVVWAAACFTPIGMAKTAFAISVAGIAIGSVPAAPEKSKSFIPDIQKLMENYIDGHVDPMDKSLRNKAKALLAAYPGITRFHAMDEFVAASFLPAFFTAKPHHTSIPILNKAAIRGQFERSAALKLDEAIEADKAERIRKTDYKKAFKQPRWH